MRGLDRSQAEDLVQDVGVRAMQSGVTFHDLDDFLCWAKPVVRNLHVDLLRSSKFSVSAAEVPDRESGAPGVEHVVERRLALQTVLHHLGAMPPGERDAIVAAASDVPDEADARPGTLAVRRHRARAHLKKLCGGVLGLGGVATLARRLRVAGVASTPAAFAALVAVPAVVFGMHVVAGHQVTAVHVAHPSLDEAVSVESADVVNDRAALPVTASSGPVPASQPASRLHDGVSRPGVDAPARLAAKPTKYRGVVVREYDGPEDAPLLCVKTDHLPQECLRYPGQVSSG
jgi:DNA-directed RNA polymerase specialized sigma24 family protein